MSHIHTFVNIWTDAGAETGLMQVQHYAKAVHKAVHKAVRIFAHTANVL